MEKLARWCFRNRWKTVGIWILLIVVLQAMSGSFGAHYKDDFKLPNTESKRALDLLMANAPKESGESMQVVVHTKSGTVDDPAIRERLTAAFDKLKTQPHVTSLDNFYEADDAQHVSQDRTIALATAQLDVNANDLGPEGAKSLVAVVKNAQNDAIQVEVGGNIGAWSNPQNGGHLSELIGVIAAAVVLFIAFGSLFTMFLPILTAVIALGAATGGIGLLTHAFSVAEFSIILATLIGLGVGIDYSLFIVSRHRNNLHMGHTPEESVVIAVNTAGRAVVFAGITVCIALLGLFLVGVSFLYGVALSASLAVLLTMTASITFLPAMLGFIGMRALSKRDRRKLAAEGPSNSEDLSPVWYRWARTIDRQPWVWGTAALLVMLLIAAPVLGLRLGVNDAGTDPDSYTTRQAYDLNARAFGAGSNGPLQLVGELAGPSDMNTMTNLADAVKETKGVVAVTPPRQLSDKVAMITVIPASSPQAKETSDLIKQLRHHVIPDTIEHSDLKVYVGGTTAIFDDFNSVLSSKLPVFFGAVVVLAAILLMILFRSLLIPLVASLMNLLSVAAAFGVVVAIFQWGWLGSIVGIDSTGPIFSFLPILLFAILFGLSMDYEVFLVSRMHEEWVRTQNNDEAIALGQAETGRVITAAAVIMVLVFASFILLDDRIIKLFGTGLATAILLDALIIRTVLVPAVMHVCGNRNWWVPEWLDRILPKVSVEPPNLHAPAAADK
jgi:putative drug exporter of the RND superfamily